MKAGTGMHGYRGNRPSCETKCSAAIVFYLHQLCITVYMVHATRESTLLCSTILSCVQFFCMFDGFHIRWFSHSLIKNVNVFKVTIDQWYLNVQCKICSMLFSGKMLKSMYSMLLLLFIISVCEDWAEEGEKGEMDQSEEAKDKNILFTTPATPATITLCLLLHGWRILQFESGRNVDFIR
jgi:hypothetical protein